MSRNSVLHRHCMYMYEHVNPRAHARGISYTIWCRSVKIKIPNPKKSTPMNGQENLIPFSKRSKEEARALGRKGGINSGEVRKNRKTMRESLIDILAKPIKKGRVRGDVDCLEDFQTANVDVQTRILAGLIAKAAKGSVQAAEFIRDTIGEKPTETFEDRTPHSPFILGTIAVEKVEKAKADHEARQGKRNDYEPPVKGND